MGRRIDLSTLADQPVPDARPDITAPTAAPAAAAAAVAASAGSRAVLLSQVAGNPVNPREEFGDLSDLESMRSLGQLQACAVVSRTAFLSIYPEHEPTIGAASYVIVAGSRRRAAAEKFGLDTLDIDVRDQLAISRSKFYAASVAENIDRKQFDVIEEARAVQRLVQECGSGTEAAEILGRTKGWVSQRIALLKLSTDMQRLLKAGELPIRDARRLAALPVEDQLSTWQEEQRQAELARFTAVNQPDDPASDDPAGNDPTNRDGKAAGGAARPRRISFVEGTPVDEIATLLRDRLSAGDIQALAEALTGLPR